MNYLISTFDCVLQGEEFFNLCANVKYKLNGKLSDKIIVFANSFCIPFVVDFENPNENILKVKIGFDQFFFLFPTFSFNTFCTSFKFKNKNIHLSLSSRLIISVDGALICEKNVENLNYSHYEIFGDVCLIYFNGKRNYVVVLKYEKVCFASYYDECNIADNEKYFMCKQYDALNHGSVCHIKDKEISTYLVYLDDEELNLKSQFVAHIFMDCVKVENFKYCSELLAENLKMKDEKMIKNFFPEFDYWYPICETKIVLTNKNTLAGIYAFEIQDRQIVNIIQC